MLPGVLVTLYVTLFEFAHTVAFPVIPDVTGLTTETVGVMAEQDVELSVNVKEALPTVCPVTIPELVTVATDVLLLIQVPPAEGFRVIAPPIHNWLAEALTAGEIIVTGKLRVGPTQPPAFVSTTDKVPGPLPVHATQTVLLVVDIPETLV